ncbi:MAG: peptidoglycan-binding domain-containing protein [Minisyncoccia bacterium]
MKKLFLSVSFLALAFYFTSGIEVSAQVAPQAYPFGKTVQGNLRVNNPITVADGEDYWFQITNAPLNAQVKLWVDNGDSKGFQDFGVIGKTAQSNTAYVQVGDFNLQKVLDCSKYEYLEPGKSLSVGNRDLFQRFYVEFVGLNKVSNIDSAVRDCSQTGDPVSTGNIIFPYTLESIYGRNNIVKPFPDSYPSGIPASLKFAGRYFDGRDRGGTNTGLGFEWYEPYGVSTNVEGGNNPRIVGNKIYLAIGGTIATYNKDTFLSRIANKANDSLAVFAGTQEHNTHDLKFQYDHSAVPWDAYIYPEHPDNAWMREFCDCHTGVTWFEADDRGYVYFSDSFGFGIARDSGSSLRIITQVRDTESIYNTDGSIHASPWLRTGKNGTVRLTDMDGYGKPNGDSSHITVVKTGGKYYAVFTGLSASGAGGTKIIDVTDPNNPAYVRSDPKEAIRKLVQAGETVAVTTGISHGGFAQTNSEIKIYNAADFINGGAPLKTFVAGPVMQDKHATAAYTGLAIDKVSKKIYSVVYSSNPRPKSSIPAYILPTASVAVFTPSGSIYTEQRYVISPETMGGRAGNPGWNGYQYIYTIKDLDYQSGYLVARGQAPDLYSDVKIWKLATGAPQELDTKDFLHEYYKGLGEIYQVSVQVIGEKAFLFVGTFYTADVYELTGAVSVTPTDPVVDNGCAAGNVYSTTTGNPCVCVLNPPFPLGTRGEEVKVLQRKLKAAGFFGSNKIDGIFGPMTAAAALAYCSSVEHPRYTPTPTPTSTAPTINTIDGPTSISVNTLGTWTARATDANGDDLTWSVNWGGGRSTHTCPINAPKGTSQGWNYTTSNSWSQTGTYTVTMYASDCRGGTVSKTTSVTVTGGGGGGGGQPIDPAQNVF